MGKSDDMIWFGKDDGAGASISGIYCCIGWHLCSCLSLDTGGIEWLCSKSYNSMDYGVPVDVWC